MRRILDDRDKTELQENLTDYKELMEKEQKQLKEDIAEADAQLDDKIETNVELLEDSISDVNTTLSNKISSTKTELQTNINTVNTTLINSLNNYKTDMMVKHTEMQTAFENADDTLQSNIDTVQSTLQQTITAVKNELQASINSSASTQTTYTDEAIASLVNGSPELLNTLNEFAIAIGNDANFAATMATELGKKVDKNGDKVLTDNNLTDELKGQYDTAYTHSQEAHAPSDAEKNIQADWSVTDTTSDAYINNKPTALKNPAQLIFAGSVSATYDGSEPITITINDASKIYMQIADGYVQYSNDNATWVNLFALADITTGALSVDENGILILA